MYWVLDGVICCLALGQLHFGEVRSLQIVKEVLEANVFDELDYP